MEIKDIVKYFRSNIYISLSSYQIWKMVVYSRSSGVVSEELSKKYTEIQNYHPDFFAVSEHAFLFQFIIYSLHSFDKRNDVASLYKLDKEKTETFVKENDIVVQKLKKARNKIFAHKDLKTETVEIPSIIDLDNFFENIISFYNDLTKNIEDSTTTFDNAKNVKYDVENLFMNLYRGEAVRKNETEIEWIWEKDDKKVSSAL